MLMRTLAVFAVLMPIPALAETPPPPDAAVAAPDPARLAEAHKLIDQVSPPEKRDAMIEGIIRPMVANMRRSFDESPEFAKIFAEKPALRTKMTSFLDGEIDRSLRIARESMPAMFDAMAVAYARRFSLEQLADVERFYASPTGRVFAEQAPTILADPAVQAAQRAMMARSLEGLQSRVKAMAEAIIADGKKG